MMKNLKYLDWTWKDWLLFVPSLVWMLLWTAILSPLAMIEYIIDSFGRRIRKNRFYERHDFGIVEGEEDELDKQAQREIFEEHVLGNFLYRSKIVRFWSAIVTFNKGELR